MSQPRPEPPDVNHFLPASLPPECRLCRVLHECGGVISDCPFGPEQEDQP